jgi:hypothetical protein
VSGSRFACQTTTWRESRPDVLDHVLRGVAACGGDGVDIGLRRVALNLHGTWLVAQQDSVAVRPTEAARADTPYLRARL